ncbi:MAG: hypothetical protein IT183_07935 [Acidobacteria bacterium]|nr:hypothetical protein [Acidobacteriota bacterium]
MRSIGALVVAMTVVLQGQAPERWRLVELWRSGGDPSRQILFDDVVDMTLAANGHLLMLVGNGAPHLLTIDNTGRLVRTVTGHPDDGFRDANGVVQLTDGTIVVNEPRVARLSVLDESGDFLRHVPYERWGYMSRWVAFVHEDGGLYEPVGQDQQLVWRRWAPDLSASEILPASGCDFGLVQAAPDAAFAIHSPFGPATIMAVPFLQPPLAIARGRDGATWTGIGPDYRRIVRTPWRSCADGPSVVLAGDPVPVPDDLRAAEQERVRKIAFDLKATLPDLERIPHVRPLFHALRIDRQDRLWVERDVTADTRAFSVFASDGRALADVAIEYPVDTPNPVVFNDNQIYYFTKDGSGWTWLVAMQIERVE